MNKGYRSNIYLQADAIRALETLFTRLQEAGDIPKNESVENVGKYRSQIITYALMLAADEKRTLHENTQNT